MNSFSQIDTTKIQIKVPVAKLIIKDIIRGDGCVEELKLTQEKVIKLETREAQKDTIIKLLEDKDNNNQLIISIQKDQLELSKELSSNLQKEIKGYRVSILGWKVGTMLGIATSLILLLN